MVGGGLNVSFLIYDMMIVFFFFFFQGDDVMCMHLLLHYSSKNTING